MQDVAKPHHPISMVSSPVWTQLSSGLWVQQYTSSHPDYLSCVAGNCTDLQFASESFSLAIWWYRVTGVGGQIQFLFAKRDASGTRGYAVSHDRANSLFYITINNTMYTITNYLITSNAWHLAVFMKDYPNSQMYCCLDGILISRRTMLHPTATIADALLIGIPPTFSVNSSWNGYLHRPRIWNRALSFAESKEMFNRERHLFGV